MFRRPVLRLLLVFCVFLSARLAKAADKHVRTVWEGVFNAEQADRGEKAYGRYCARCHGEDFSKSGNVLLGAKFMAEWREDTVKSLFAELKDSMPRDAPRSLSDTLYTDLVAYMLRINSFPAGQQELTLDAMSRIRIVGKEGPQPAPDFAFVGVVGCLAQISADTWALKDASEPVRTHDPRQSADTDLADVKEQSAGQHTFRLVNTRNFPDQIKTGHWMEAKGLLIRASDNNQISLTSLQTLGETCKQRQ